MYSAVLIGLFIGLSATWRTTDSAALNFTMTPAKNTTLVTMSPPFGTGQSSWQANGTGEGGAGWSSWSSQNGSGGSGWGWGGSRPLARTAVGQQPGFRKRRRL
ncbi:unnamed protein product, partial [Ixodes pacificus]